MADGNEKALSHPQQTLAMLLEFLSRLEESEQKDKVIEEIKKKVTGYVKDDGQTFGNPTNGYLFETIKQSTELRRNIVKSAEKYEHYDTAFDRDGLSDEQYTELLIDNIFPLFGCLYYTYYECSGVCRRGIQGAEWQAEKCDGKGSGQYLNKWLQDTTGTSTERMIQRGFKQDELSEKTGDDLFPSGSSKDSLLDYLYAAQLQFALFFMLFLPKKWDNAQSGHALLFLEAFCKMASGGQFNGQYPEADEGDGGDEKFKAACESLRESINTLTGLKIIVPVTWTPEVQYKNLLEARHFWDYVKWLLKNLQELIDSLQGMASDVPKWNQGALKASSTFGPFPWGFTFRNYLESNKEDFKSKLQELITALENLKNALPSTSEGNGRSKRSDEESSASTASTLGGVAAGVGAAGAAGAAAYSGLLGPVADGMGRFFKALLL